VVQPITICRRLDGWKPIIKECHSLQLVAAYCGFFLQRQWGVGEQSASLRQEASVSVSYHGPKTGGIPPAKGVSSHQACGRPRRVAPRWVLLERSVCFSWAYSRRAVSDEDRWRVTSLQFSVDSHASRHQHGWGAAWSTSRCSGPAYGGPSKASSLATSECTI
jgi:hypothetical protein